MKILIYNWRDLKHTWAGGGEIYIFEQAKRWVKLGHSVTLFCGQDIDDNLPEVELIDGITIHRKGSRYSVYLWGLWFWFTKFRGNFDIIIDVVNGIPFFTPLYTSTPKLAVVYHVHGDQFFYEIPFPLNFIGSFIERHVFPLVYRHTHIVAISRGTKYELVKHGHPSDLIKIVYCGMNGKKGLKHSLPKKFKHPTILYLGRIKKYKRVDLLVKVFPKIIESVADARLIIAGWGTEASMITDLVMRSPLRRKISLMGPVSTQEKKELLTRSSVFVNPSIGEGWGLAVIEANLYGTPAVSFRVRGLSESIKHGITGLSARSDEDFITHICTLLKNKAYAAKLGKNAKHWAMGFDWDKTANRSLRLLKRVHAKTA